jgi:hypothetical protein
VRYWLVPAWFGTVTKVPRLLGYATASTTEQHLDLRHDAEGRPGCERVFAHGASGDLDERPWVWEESEQTVATTASTLGVSRERICRHLAPRASP